MLPLVRPHPLRWTDPVWLASEVPLYTPPPQLSIAWPRDSPAGTRLLPEFGAAAGLRPQDVTVRHFIWLEGRPYAGAHLRWRTSPTPGSPGPQRQCDGRRLLPDAGRGTLPLSGLLQVQSPPVVLRSRHLSSSETHSRPPECPLRTPSRDGASFFTPSARSARTSSDDLLTLGDSLD